MMVKILALVNKEILVSQIEEVGADIGEPDCKLIKPFKIDEGPTPNELVIQPWLFQYTTDTTFMMQSDKILTITEPSPAIIEKYNELIK